MLSQKNFLFLNQKKNFLKLKKKKKKKKNLLEKQFGNIINVLYCFTKKSFS